MQQVHFEFDGEHAHARRHETEGGVATGGICDGGYDAGVDEAVLLTQLLTEWQHDFSLTGLHRAQLRPQELHRVLPAKTGAHTLSIVGVLGGHVVPASRCLALWNAPTMLSRSTTSWTERSPFALRAKGVLRWCHSRA